jgi:F420-dependent oxidoreductase-like protein
VKLALHVRHLGDLREARALVHDLESAGLDVINVSESYTFDAVSQVGYLAAITERVEIATTILNVFSRSAAAIAMTAASCDALTGGRFVLGLGTSGPQVIEGFHGIPYEKGIDRIHDYIEVTRKVLRREPLEHTGPTVTIPFPSAVPGESRRPLKLINHPVRSRVPIWWAAITGRAVETAAEVADGWLPAWFIPDQIDKVYGARLSAGRSRRSPELGPLEISAGVAVGLGEDPEAVADSLRPGLALYVGGMGSRATNYYNRLGIRYGYAEEAALMQELYLGGRRAEAEAAVPREWIGAMTIAGSRQQAGERLAAYRDAGVTVLDVNPYGGDAVRTIAGLRELVDAF